jgi:hypothetical protein
MSIKKIDNATPRTKKYKMADGGGLCLLVPPSGAKLWVWRYRFDGTEKNMHFGEYPLVTLKGARELHFAARKILAAGIDPMAERKAEAEAKQREAEAQQPQPATQLRIFSYEWLRKGVQVIANDGIRRFREMCIASLDRRALSNTFHLSGDTFHVSPWQTLSKTTYLRKA